MSGLELHTNRRRSFAVGTKKCVQVIAGDCDSALISVEWIQSAQEKPFEVGVGGTTAGGENLRFDNMKNQGIFSDELEFADFCLLAIAKFPRWLQTVQRTLFSDLGERSPCCLEWLSAVSRLETDPHQTVTSAYPRLAASCHVTTLGPVLSLVSRNPSIPGYS